MRGPQTAKQAFRFVLIIGLVNLFADMTYEGARGITGPFLGSLGASAAVVGFVAGFGELVGYGLRSVSGYLADRTHKYWVVIFTGYAVNMLAVPALALAGNWPLAAGLIKTALMPQSFVPVLYAVAMATGALTSLVFGRLLDRWGRPVVLVAFFLSALFAPFVFLGGFGLACVGMVLWGLGMGAQDSLFKALLAGVVPPEKRSTAFGIFDTAFGVAWFVGSAAMGLLYGKMLVGLVAFSVVLQLAALPLFARARRVQERM